mgnify:CR=1 FL=1
MSEQKSHIIDLSTLEVGHYVFDYQLNNAYFATIEKTELLGGQISAKAILDLREEDFDLTIGVEGIVQVTCDRCLDPMDIRMDVEERVNLEDEGEESVDKIKTIDLDWLAYEMAYGVINVVSTAVRADCQCGYFQNVMCTTFRLSGVRLSSFRMCHISFSFI